jgi:hypothetical protein
MPPPAHGPAAAICSPARRGQQPPARPPACTITDNGPGRTGSSICKHSPVTRTPKVPRQASPRPSGLHRRALLGRPSSNNFSSTNASQFSPCATSGAARRAACKPSQACSAMHLGSGVQLRLMQGPSTALSAVQGVLKAARRRSERLGLPPAVCRLLLPSAARSPAASSLWLCGGRTGAEWMLQTGKGRFVRPDTWILMPSSLPFQPHDRHVRATRLSSSHVPVQICLDAAALTPSSQ